MNKIKEKKEIYIYKPDFESIEGRKEVLKRLYTISKIFTILLFIIIFFMLTISLLYITDSKEQVANAEETYTIENTAIKRSIIAKNTTLADYADITMNVGTVPITGKIISIYQTKYNNTLIQEERYSFDSIQYENLTNIKRVALYDENTYKTAIILIQTSASAAYKQIIEFNTISEMNTFLNRKVYTANNIDVFGYDLFETIEDYYVINEYTEESTENANFTYTYTYVPYRYTAESTEYGNIVSHTIQQNTAATRGFYIEIQNVENYNYVQVAIEIEHTDPYEKMYKDPYIYALNFRNIMPVNNTIYVDYANQAFTQPIEYTVQTNGLVERKSENWIGLISMIQFNVQLSGTENNAIIANIPFASQDYIEGYESAIQYIDTQKQSAYNKGYTEGLATAETGDFYHLISAVFSVPVQTITGFADVNIMGVNMLTVLRALLTISIIAMIIKFFV